MSVPAAGAVEAGFCAMAGEFEGLDGELVMAAIAVPHGFAWGDADERDGVAADRDCGVVGHAT